MARLPEVVKNLGSLSASQFEQFMLSQKMLLDEEIKQNAQNMKYKIFNVKDLLSEIQYQGVRKGTKTEAYLEDVIKSVNESGKYKWYQFFQLVDVFYVVVVVVDKTTKTSQEEIRDHYKKAEPTAVQEVVEQVTEAANKAGQSLQKANFPWKNK